MKYLITSTQSNVSKVADTYEQAVKIATQMTLVFGVLFTIKEANDVWEFNFSK